MIIKGKSIIKLDNTRIKQSDECPHSNNIQGEKQILIFLKRGLKRNSLTVPCV